MSTSVDVLAVLDRLVGNTCTMACLSGDPRMRENLRDGVECRAAVAELIERAGKVAARPLPAVTDANAAEQYDMLGLRNTVARCKGAQA
jgi:hypothetical protein